MFMRKFISLIVFFVTASCTLVAVKEKDPKLSKANQSLVTVFVEEIEHRLLLPELL